MRPCHTYYFRFILLLSLYSSNDLLLGQDSLLVDTTKLTHVSHDRGYFRQTAFPHDAASSGVHLKNRIANTVDQHLQGSAAGVYAIENSGQPASEITLQIRGIHTLAGNNQPLFVIDGIPFYNETALTSAGTTFGPRISPLTFLNPEDIESITVLKDAGASILYGSRATNGVIIIRTKRKADSPQKISFHAQTGIQQPIGSYDLANASQFANFLNQAHTNAGQDAPYSNPSTFGTGTDWQDQIYRDPAWRQQYHLGVSGGTDQISFLLSGQYLSQKGLVIGSGLERYNFHANIDAEISDRLKLQNSLNFGRLDLNSIASDAASDESGIDVITGSRIFNPILPHLNEDGSINIFHRMADNGGLPTSVFQSALTQPNPLLLAGSTDSKMSTNRITNYLSLSYLIRPNLTLHGSLGLDGIFNEEYTFIPGLLFFTTSDGVGSGAKMDAFKFINQYHIHFNETFSTSHTVDAMAGFSTEGYRREFLAGQSVGFDNESLRYYSLTVGQQKSLRSDISEWGMRSYFGKVSYAYRQIYNLSLAARADAVSTFGGQYQLFPAVSFSWNPGNTNLLKSHENISSLVVRTSYGLTGNQAIDPYSRFTLLNEFNSALNGGTLNGIGLNRLGNDDLEIEKTRQFNLGAHLGLSDETLIFDLDFYHNQTSNAIALLPLAGTTGYEYVLANAASISNQGLEFSFSGNKKFGEISWSSQFISGFNKNKILTTNQDLPLINGEQILGIREWSIIQSGQSASTFYGYLSDGLVQNNLQAPAFAGQTLQNGDLKYQDLNGDGLINRNDQTHLGNALPKVTLGFYNSWSFKGLDLNLFLQGALGHDLANFNRLLLENPTGETNVSLAYLEQAGSTLPIPRQQTGKQQVFSELIIEDGSYVRVKNITLGYSMPGHLVRKIAASKFRIYLSAENLWTFTKYSGIDPDVSHFGSGPTQQGIDLGGYPKSKLFIAGINLDF